MDERLKKLLADLSSMREKKLTEEEINEMIKKYLGVPTNVAVPKASTLSSEERLRLFQNELIEEQECTIKEIEEKIKKYRDGGK